MDEEVKKVQKLYCNRAMFYAIGGFIILLFLDQKAVGKGLVLGTLFSILNFVIMGILIEQQIAGAQKKMRARSRSFLSIFFRLAILAVPLVISIKTESISFYGTVVGIFMVQLTILFNNLVIGRFFKIRKA